MAEAERRPCRPSRWPSCPSPQRPSCCRPRRCPWRRCRPSRSSSCCRPCRSPSPPAVLVAVVPLEPAAPVVVTGNGHDGSRVPPVALPVPAAPVVLAAPAAPAVVFAAPAAPVVGTGASRGRHRAGATRGVARVGNGGVTGARGARPGDTRGVTRAGGRRGACATIASRRVRNQGEVRVFSSPAPAAPELPALPVVWPIFAPTDVDDVPVPLQATPSVASSTAILNRFMRRRKIVESICTARLKRFCSLPLGLRGVDFSTCLGVSPRFGGLSFSAPRSGPPGR